MRVAAGDKVVRAALGCVLATLMAVSKPAHSAAQAPPDPPQRWDGLIERLSVPGNWQPESFSNPRMSRHAVSEDGKYVVFMADVPNPPYGPSRELFVRDRLSGYTLVPGPGPLNAPPVISGDGDHRALELCDVLRAGGQRVCDVWVMDVPTNRMENMSTSLDGTPSDGDSSEAMLSRNGRFVVFRTNSSTLLPANAAPGQIVLRDRDTDQDGILDEPDASSLRVVSVSSTGEPGNFESGLAEVSADGRFVAFRSRASNLVPGDTNDAWDVFLHDVKTGETRRINVGWDGQQGTSAIDSPAISMSADGAFIAFATDAPNMTDPTHPSDTNNALDVIVYDRVAGTLARIDLGAGGTLGNGHTHWPSLSADGRYVSVVSSATNVANPGTPGRYHAFVFDRATAQATRVSVKPDGTEPDRDCVFATISGDGSLVTFVSQATNLPTAAPPDTDSIYAAVHFKVTPLTLTLPARGGEVVATVTAQRYVRWDFQLADWSWLNWGSGGAYGMGDGPATFRASRNQDVSPRTTTAVAHDTTIAITQEAGLHITGFSPSHGPATGGTPVTIAGDGFEPGMRVYFEAVGATAVEFVDTTTLRVVTPPHAAGDAWLYIATADSDGSAGAPGTFRFTDVTPPDMFPPWLGGARSEDGWFTSDVQIAFGFWDPDSAILSSEGCFPPALTTDTPGTTYTCSATSEGGTSTASVVVKRDATGPAIEIAAPAPTIYRVGDPAPVASYTCTDALTSVADCMGSVPLQSPVDMTPGYHDFWVNARDRLGNWSSQWFTYAVTEGNVCAPRPDGLVAWFAFENTYADAVNGSELIPVNTQFVPGAVGSFAMAPAGSPSYARIEYNDLFRMNSAFTLAAWIKPGASTGDFEVIAGREGEYMLGLSPDGTLQWSLSTPTREWGWTPTYTQLQRNVWAHVALVYDGTQVTVYVNGITRQGWSTSGTVGDAAWDLNEFRIGAREDPAAPSYFSGAIDDVLVASRAFSSTELQGIALAANAGLCGRRPTTVTVTPDPVTVTYGGSVNDVYTLTLTSAGFPVPGRTLYFFDPTGYLLAPAQTDANGQIRFGATAWGTSVGTQRGFEARFMGDFYYTAASGTNVLVVERALPVITWPAPAPVPYGTPLGAAQLNAAASVPGTFTYTPAAGTQLSVGSHTLTVQFDPTDATNYRSATATTTLTIVDATPPLIVPSAVGTLGANGWYTSDVAISFSVQDPESSVASMTGCAPTTLSSDTAGVTYTCSATSAGGTASASVSIKRDTIGPAINMVVPTATLYESTFPGRTNYWCTDPLSGTATCAGVLPNDAPLDLTPGYHTFTVTATDRAGNTSTKAVTYAVGLGACAVRPAGLVAWWPFEEPNTGGGTIGSYRDIVSGTFDSGVYTELQFGQGAVGSFALSTKWNTSAYLTAGTRAQLQRTGPLTIAGWVYPVTLGVLGVIAGREGEYLIARSPTGTLRYSLATTSPGWGWVDTGYLLGTNWSHVALTYDGAFVRVYVNGREVHAAPASGPIGDVAPALNEFRIGGRQDPSAPSRMSGLIDDVMLYGRALDASEIQGIFLAGAKGLCDALSVDLGVQPNPLHVTYGTTRDVELAVRVSRNGSPVPGRTITVFKSTTAIGSGVSDANGEVRVTTTVTGVISGTSPAAFRVDHTGDLYYAAQSTFVSLVTDKATPQITWPAPQPIAYGTALSAAQLTATANVAGTFAYTPSAGTVLPVGTHMLSTTFTPTSTQNYTTATATVPLEVTKATPTIAIAAPQATYDGQPHGATGTVTGVGGAGLGALTFTYNGSPELPIYAGTYTVVASYAGDANYNPASATATLTIARADATVTATGGNYTYDRNPHPATGTATGAGGATLGPLTFTYSGSPDAPINAGTYNVVASYTGDANHNPASATATLTIARADATVTATGGNYTYDRNPHPATGTATGVGGVTLGPLTFTYNGSPDVPVNAGTYDVVASFAGDANHASASATATITIAKATATVSATGGSYTYDGAAHPATGTVTGVGGVTLGPLTFTYNGSADVPINAGSYAVVASFAGDANYSGATAGATIAIAKAASVLQWAAPAGIMYGTSLGATQLSATANTPGTFAYSPAAGAVLGAGDHALGVTFTPADTTNYTAASASTSVTVTPAPLTVRAIDAVKRFGAPLPVLTATMTGFVNGDSAMSLSGALALGTSATQQSPVGAYPIVPSGLSSPNYTIAFVMGTLSVVRGSVDVMVTTSPEPSGLDAPMTFTASVAAALPSAGNPTGTVRFYDGATLIGSAALDAGTAMLSTAGLDAGVRTIEARYDGNGSFEPGVGSASHVIRDASQTASLVMSSSRNPSNAGQSVTFTATVSMPSGAVTGVVEFYSGDVLLATSPISSGRATFTTSSLATGSYAMTARYTGAAGVPPARSDVFVQSVGATGWKNRATSMAVTATPNPAALGDTVVVTADVTGSSSAMPTGHIVFMVDGVVIADIAAAPLSGTTARAAISLPGLAHGRHAVSATYLGDPTYKGSTARVTQTVN